MYIPWLIVDTWPESPQRKTASLQILRDKSGENKWKTWILRVLYKTSKIIRSSAHTSSQVHACRHIQRRVAEMRYKASQDVMVTRQTVGVKALQQQLLCLVASAWEKNLNWTNCSQRMDRNMYGTYTMWYELSPQPEASHAAEPQSRNLDAVRKNI